MRVRGQVRGQLDLDLVKGVWSGHGETDDTQRSHRFADSPFTRQELPAAWVKRQDQAREHQDHDAEHDMVDPEPWLSKVRDDDDAEEDRHHDRHRDAYLLGGGDALLGSNDEGEQPDREHQPGVHAPHDGVKPVNSARLVLHQPNRSPEPG